MTGNRGTMDSYSMEKLPKEAFPEITGLKGDLRVLAEIVGVRTALIISERFEGTPIHLWGHRKFARNFRNKQMQEEYDKGGVSVVALARKYGLCDRQVTNILKYQP